MAHHFIFRLSESLLSSVHRIYAAQAPLNDTFFLAGCKEYSQIPVGIKIFKLIVSEFSNELEKIELAEDDNDDEDDEVCTSSMPFC